MSWLVVRLGPVQSRMSENRMLVVSSRHLQTVLDEYVAHYKQRRPHRARSLRPPDGGETITAPVTGLATARIRHREVLGGLIHLIHGYELAA